MREFRLIFLAIFFLGLWMGTSGVFVADVGQNLPTGIKRISRQRLNSDKATKWCDLDTEQLPKAYLDPAEITRSIAFDGSSRLLEFSSNYLSPPSPWWAECIQHKSRNTSGKMCAMDKKGNMLQTDFAYAICCWKTENCPLGIQPVGNRVIFEDIRTGNDVSNFFGYFHSISAVVISIGLLCHIRIAWAIRTKRTHAELVMQALIMCCFIASDILAIFSALYLSMETINGMARAVLIQFSFGLASQLTILLGFLANIFRSSIDASIEKITKSMNEGTLKGKIYLFTSLLTLLVPCAIAWVFMFRQWTPPYLIRLVYLSNWTFFRNDEAFLTMYITIRALTALTFILSSSQTCIFCLKFDTKSLAMNHCYVPLVALSSSLCLVDGFYYLAEFSGSNYLFLKSLALYFSIMGHYLFPFLHSILIIIQASKPLASSRRIIRLKNNFYNDQTLQ